MKMRYCSDPTSINKHGKSFPVLFSLKYSHMMIQLLFRDQTKIIRISEV